MPNEIVVGIDLGSTFIRAAVGKQDSEGNIEILSIAKVPSMGHVHNGEIFNIHKTASALSEVLKKATSTVNGKSQDVYYVTNITGPHIQVRNFSVNQNRENPSEPVAAEEIIQLGARANNSISDSNNHLLHAIPLGFKVDQGKDTLDPVGSIGSLIQGDYLFVTADKDKYDTLKRTNFSSDLKSIKGGNTVFSLLATEKAVITEEEKTAGVALVDLGSGTSEIGVYQNNRLRNSKVISWGGDQITEDISIGLNISLDHAEAIKTKFGTSLSKEIDLKEVVLIPGIAGRKPTPVSVKNLSIIIEERVRELAAAIFVEISKVTDPDALKGGIVLVGGGAQLPDIAESIQKMTGIECRIGEPTERANSLSLEEEMNNPEYASTLGLVKLYFEQIDITNSMPVIEEKQEPSFPGAPTSTPQPKQPEKQKVDLRKFLNRVVEVVMGNDEEIPDKY
ncbi:cell division protein FtsA [Sandaracinomonas limnophila]|jgi:cell division protein FtsA|uniref:Cell division protein FtsA n=1 Tax=Sandaracinomonas limnophila TaxID=1862386 RepID=A0A437PRQ1_9BACT|nr:cell division protein FtsA [Sandaracinomonas limnophila]RVU24927.1 cell division protein FtsA [Sandaracinomonas limnophila]